MENPARIHVRAKLDTCADKLKIMVDGNCSYPSVGSVKIPIKSLMVDMSTVLYRTVASGRVLGSRRTEFIILSGLSRTTVDTDNLLSTPITHTVVP